jgi:hypothetical protein
MHGPIPVGIATKLGIGISILALLPPILTEIVAAVENSTANLSGGDKTSAIIGAVSAISVILTRGAQAVAAIIKGR